jgi:hypothetical protein
MEQKIVDAIIAYIRENTANVSDEYKIIIDGKIFNFVEDDFDDDFITLREFITKHNKRHPGNKIEEKYKKSYYLLTDYSSVRILDSNLVSSFDSAFLEKKFATIEGTYEIKPKETN